MSSTENAAAIFFADLLLPLHYARLRRGAAYLDRGSRRASYWAPVSSRTGGMERLSAEGYDAAALLALVGKFWETRKETDLLRLALYLETLCRELSGSVRAEQAPDRVPDFIYPMF
jgi:hypothetical protein